MSSGKDQKNTMYIKYNIKLKKGHEAEFRATLDYDSLDIILEPVKDPPGWTQLNFHQCPNCPLDVSDHERCPVAVNITELIAFLRDLTSWEEVEVRVETRQRAYSAGTTLQNVAGSLMGIYMVTSGCPILNKMRPMVETHLPFASWQETVYRVVSMYLFSQYFRMKSGLTPNWELQGLVDYYAEVQKVNVAFAQRLSAIPYREGDASLNAVSILSGHAMMASMKIQEGDLTHWEKIIMDHWG